jgi:hypothetical protein
LDSRAVLSSDDCVCVMHHACTLCCVPNALPGPGHGKKRRSARVWAAWRSCTSVPRQNTTCRVNSFSVDLG